MFAKPIEIYLQAISTSETHLEMGRGVTRPKAEASEEHISKMELILRLFDIIGKVELTSPVADSKAR